MVSTLAVVIMCALPIVAFCIAPFIVGIGP